MTGGETGTTGERVMAGVFRRRGEGLKKRTEVEGGSDSHGAWTVYNIFIFT